LKGKQLAEDVKVYKEMSANLIEIMTPIGFWGQVFIGQRDGQICKCLNYS
jgi:hypothetical protein